MKRFWPDVALMLAIVAISACGAHFLLADGAPGFAMPIHDAPPWHDAGRGVAP